VISLVASPARTAHAMPTSSTLTRLPLGARSAAVSSSSSKVIDPGCRADFHATVI
jgi:hypothetical protein